MAAKVHLHRDYSTAFCGKDAAHIPMTYAIEDATCKTCLSTLDRERQQHTAARDKHAAAAEKVMGIFEPATVRLNDLNAEINTLQEEHGKALAAKIAERDAAHQEHLELAQQGAAAITAKNEAEAALAALPSTAE